MAKLIKTYVEFEKDEPKPFVHNKKYERIYS